MGAARRVSLVVLAVGITLVVVVGIFPTRTWLEQQAAARRASEQVDALDRENAELEQEIADLQDPEVVADLARRDFSMVKPGEEAYVVLPPADEDSGGTTVVAPTDPAAQPKPATGARWVVELTWDGLTNLW